MVRFGSERMQQMFSMLGDDAIENKSITKAISSAQKRVEGTNFDIRKTLLDYDDVLRQQRETIYEQRNFILENDDIHAIVNDMYRRVVNRVIENNVMNDAKKPYINDEGYHNILKQLNIDEGFENNLIDKNIDEVKTLVFDKTWSDYEHKIEPVKKEIQEHEKVVVLRTIDRAWVNHIDLMDKLRNGIHLRSYAQDNPLQAYVHEGFEMFEEMMNTISYDVVQICINLKIVFEAE